MKSKGKSLAKTRASIGALLDEALALADYVEDHLLAARIAEALDALDPSRTIAMPPDDEASH